VEMVAGADGGVAGEIHVRPDPAARAERDMRVNHGAGADLDRGIQLGFWTNDGRWMDHATGFIKGTTPPKRQAPPSLGNVLIWTN